MAEDLDLFTLTENQTRLVIAETTQYGATLTDAGVLGPTPADAFTLTEIVEPEYHIVIHASQIREVKRIYTAIQTFYDLIIQDPDKPWKMTLIGQWESGYKEVPRREYLQALRELIQILDFPPNRFFMIPQDLPPKKWISFAKTADIYWCTSWRESFGASMGEVVASGGRPFVNNYLGATQIYPAEVLCNTPNEMVQKTIAWGNLSVEEKLNLRKENRKLMEPFDCRKATKNMRVFIEKIEANSRSKKR